MDHKEAIDAKGFAILENMFDEEEVNRILASIEAADKNSGNFRRSNDLFAIRQFLKEVPQSIPLVFTEKFKSMLQELLGKDYFVVKSIYFNKPPLSNWTVPWHQDLTIAVDRKAELEGYSCWTTKQNQFAVQPPLAVLQTIYTVRIHLDATNEHNGALKVLEGSHRHGIWPHTSSGPGVTETTCRVSRGGVHILRPLLVHSSVRSTGALQRRVIHLEFSNSTPGKQLQWAEKLMV